MVKLTGVMGHPVWVNPIAVQLVRDAIRNDQRTGNSFVTMVSGEHFEVNCYSEVIVNMLEG